ncbi:UDP-N-acetylglucosamine--N-acetylmuramyl-pentapeptide pyrophosphoryl-undecaprenol N-acetylglucosamine transferase [Ferriphaselus amnicola]|uniref:UDP-N-acetylglucosamine--N-acetylmuramyl-(pentapeptide) pyrophosphoryl-undecaprenol N-acetylglucosamine transferase n=1 Tax=Ferriphaselus amnicola TaxID=1188319 RepID=A0A2Z6G8L8_9PROT|nr:undecaprenyldiphospho-muramoylpentapeptide beta-N-acetylglucosaminyltransferase [Ferriphaselus amnicola]BBE49810.1 UDP-N-acetylglucosamine--N-acetylmuramyl-pentapeptide pyrophosphoryl-undecaprenol N-acetylglucosamine transferase [Ferriphaselus amnicola]
MSTSNILIMAGGTGGHIYPGLAVADVLRGQGWNVTWLGAPNSMEAELVPKHGYPVANVNFGGLRGKGLLRKLMLPINLLRALAQSAAAIFRHRPDVVLGMGGYITFPGGLMAWLLRRPVMIHEQNSVAGLSNKALGKLAARVLSGFPKVLPNAEWVGNPVRASIAQLPIPANRYAGRSGPLNVLVVGGSLGAKALNECLPQALALLPQADRPRVTHQTGKQHFAAVEALYQQADITAEVRPFLDDMDVRYANADLVICRSGALTVAELAAAGVASILVPFPFAVDDHQTGNAKFLAEQGAAVLLPQTELTPQKLAQLLRDMTRERAQVMAEAARRLAKPDAAQKVAQICAELADA